MYPCTPQQTCGVANTHLAAKGVEENAKLDEDVAIRHCKVGLETIQGAPPRDLPPKTLPSVTHGTHTASRPTEGHTESTD